MLCVTCSGSKIPISDEIAHLSLFVINVASLRVHYHVPLSPKNAKCVPFWIQRVDALYGKCSFPPAT